MFVGVDLKTRSRTVTPSTELSPATAQHQLIEMWVHGKSPRTAESYRRSARQFLDFVGKPLHLVAIAEVQAFTTELRQRDISASTQRNIIAAIKSLLSFGNKIGVLPVNVGAPVSPPKVKDTLNQRILSELEIQTMIVLETNQRNRVILRLLYTAGLRVSELCDLKWFDVKERPAGGQVTVYGKGGKTRTVLLPASLWVELMQLRGEAAADAPVFQSRKGNHDAHLDRVRVYQIVAAAAKRAGIQGKVSPHWLRHAHASHSLERGAPIHLVQQTLGHASVATTSRYLHARPNDSSALYLP